MLQWWQLLNDYQVERNKVCVPTIHGFVFYNKYLSIIFLSLTCDEHKPFIDVLQVNSRLKILDYKKEVNIICMI